MGRTLVLVVAGLFVAACKASAPGEVAEATTPLALEGFEGEIDFTRDVAVALDRDASVHGELAVLVKGDEMRVERDKRWVTITDGAAKQVVVLDTTAHTFLTDRMHEPRPVTTSAKRTGADTVAGTPCELWEIDEPLGHTTFCLAAGIRKSFMSAAGPTSDGAQGDERDALLAKGFPLREITRAASGQTMFHAEATRIVRRPVSNADFAVPPGYNPGERLELRQNQ